MSRRLHGTIKSELRRVKKWKQGDPIVLKDSQVKDWKLAKPGGAVEGDFVERFTQTYVP